MGRRLRTSDRALARLQAGFTYLGLLILIGILGVAATATLQTHAVLQRRAAEQELLAVGAEFARALASYAAVTPAGQPPAPATLQELLRDPRFPMPVRHLRRLYADPITGTASWGTVLSPEHQRIVAVHSLSMARPLKVANFDAEFQMFEGSAHYSDWVFGSPGQAPLQTSP